MGVYIPGMEMPARCGKCPLHKLWPHDDEVQCLVNRELWTTSYKRHPDCPLRHVPAHGRLIDADALRDVQQKDADLFRHATSLADKSRRDEALNAVANIVNAPTVIDAEEAET